MISGRTVVAVVPALDEEALIGPTLRGLPDFVDRIIVVDDGSVDRTAREARVVPRVTVLRHPTNRGAGAAIATGCQRARSIGADVVVVFAADGQMDPRDTPALLEPLLLGRADFVKGNRLDWPAARSEIPWLRWLGNRAFSWLTRLAIGVPTRDAQCGYVAMNRTTLEAIPWERLWPTYGYPNDLLCELVIRRLRVAEVVVRPVYGAERSGIRLRHVVFSIPFVIARAWVRCRGVDAIPHSWPTSTSSMVTPTASARSPSSETSSRGRAR